MLGVEGKFDSVCKEASDADPPLISLKYSYVHLQMFNIYEATKSARTKWLLSIKDTWFP